MKKTILLIDDDEGILDALSIILEDEGFTVEILSKSDQIFKKITHTHPDIIVLDILLSGTDGREICKKLKSDLKTQKIPLIMTSAHPGAEKSAKDAGADDFISKPFAFDLLMSKITKLTS